MLKISKIMKLLENIAAVAIPGGLVWKANKVFEEEKFTPLKEEIIGYSVLAAETCKVLGYCYLGYRAIYWGMANTEYGMSLTETISGLF